MSFARQRVPGAWLLSSVVDPAEFEYFDDAISKAIDGTGGGAYALEADLIIGGAPGVWFEVDIPTRFHDMVTMNESLSVSEGITCFGEIETQQLEVNFTAQFDGAAEFNGWSTFNDDVILENVVTLRSGGQFFFYGTTGFYNRVFFEPGCDPLFDAPVEFNDPVAINAPVTVGSGGYVKKRVLVVTTSTPPGGVSPNDYDEIQLAPGAYAGTGGFAIIKDDVEDGAAMTVVTLAPIQVTLFGGATALGLLHATAGNTGPNTHMRRIEARRVGGVWIAFDSQPS